MKRTMKIPSPPRSAAHSGPPTTRRNQHPRERSHQDRQQRQDAEPRIAPFANAWNNRNTMSLLLNDDLSSSSSSLRALARPLYTIGGGRGCTPLSTDNSSTTIRRDTTTTTAPTYACRGGSQNQRLAALLQEALDIADSFDLLMEIEENCSNVLLGDEGTSASSS